MDLQKDSFLNYSETSASPDYLQLNLIRDFETDASGKIWLTTFGSGLYVYEHGKSYEKAFTHITAKKWPDQQQLLCYLLQIIKTGYGF
ncbi:MAG: hypothetical protein WDO16_19980 [Bacteroidota bacterium]